VHIISDSEDENEKEEEDDEDLLTSQSNSRSPSNKAKRKTKNQNQSILNNPTNLELNPNNLSHANNLDINLPSIQFQPISAFPDIISTTQTLLHNLQSNLNNKQLINDKRIFLC